MELGEARVSKVQTHGGCGSDENAIDLSIWPKVRSRDLKWCKMEWLQDNLWEKPKVLI